MMPEINLIHGDCMEGLKNTPGGSCKRTTKDCV
jgi:hypothetical protein